eukprot:3511831-Amphidinium_carterae.1
MDFPVSVQSPSKEPFSPRVVYLDGCTFTFPQLELLGRAIQYKHFTSQLQFHLHVVITFRLHDGSYETLNDVWIVDERLWGSDAKCVRFRYLRKCGLGVTRAPKMAPLIRATGRTHLLHVQGLETRHRGNIS